MSANATDTRLLELSVLLSAARTGSETPAVPSKITRPRSDWEGVALCVKVGDALGVYDCEGVSDRVCVTVGLPVTERDCELEGVRVCVPLGVTDRVRLRVSVPEDVDVCERDRVTVGVPEDVIVMLVVWVGVEVGLAVGDEDADCA